MDPIEFPENLTELADEALTALVSEARTALSALLEIERPTVAQANEAERLSTGIATVEGETTARAEAITRMESLRQSLQADPDPEPEPEVVPEPEPAAPAVEPTATAAVETAPEPDLSALEGQRPEDAPVARSQPRITAAADVAGVGTGQEMSYDRLAEALLDKYQAFPQPSGKNEWFGGDLRTFGLAQIDKNFPDDLVIRDSMGPQEIEAVLTRAIDQTRLPSGNLVAAGGWCSPSEVSYNMSDTGETTEGMISLPEVGMGRGGIRRTLGPDFADIYALTNFFKMTEAQAIAGSFTKPCFTVTCPTFADFRLDAYGYCFQVPFLTEAAYPEVIKRYLSGSMVAYAHKMNADKIARVIAALPSAETVAAVGSTTTTLFGRIRLILDRERTKRRWSMTQTVECKLPMWVKNAIKTDINLRTGTPYAPISDATINALFSAENCAVEWLYDWAGQDLGTSVDVYPSTFDMLLYRAGTFVVGTTKVVSLSSVYDAASLASNMYTGAFFEEGMTLVPMSYGGVRLTVPNCLAGLTGAANVACALV